MESSSEKGKEIGKEVMQLTRQLPAPAALREKCPIQILCIASFNIFRVTPVLASRKVGFAESVVILLQRISFSAASFDDLPAGSS